LNYRKTPDKVRGMWGTIVIAGHNEGENLIRTVQSVRETAWALGLEIVVADDASTDDSVVRLRTAVPEARIVSHTRRQGSSPTKDLGARAAKGDILIFLDGHTKPEPGSIFRLLKDVHELNGEAIVMPSVPALDVERWENARGSSGHGFALKLPDFEGHWLSIRQMRRRGAFFDSPTLCGCCFAISRSLYEKLRGFDSHFIQWGPEDFDLGLKAWLLGHPIVSDPLPAIGHLFRSEFPYLVQTESILANKIRIAWKNFTPEGFQDWLEVFRPRQAVDLWNHAWSSFQERFESAEEERQYLMNLRVHDESWFAREFACGWPHA
jgi:GT2 family glycosyltransferase